MSLTQPAAPKKKRLVKPVVRIVGQSRTLQRDAETGAWTSGAAFGHDILRVFMGEPKGTKEELLDYSTQVASDMLNNGDCSTNDPQHMNAAVWGTLAAGRALGGPDKWNTRTQMPAGSDQTFAIAAMAQLRAANYFTEQAELGRHASKLADNSSRALSDDARKVPATVRSDRLISNPRLFRKKVYTGEDGLLIHRYAETPLGTEAQTILDVNIHSQGSYWANQALGRVPANARHIGWLAAYLMAETTHGSPLRHKAESYIAQSGGVDDSFWSSMASFAEDEGEAVDVERVANALEAVGHAPALGVPLAQLHGRSHADLAIAAYNRLDGKVF